MSSSSVDPNFLLLFFSDSDPGSNPDPDPVCLLKIHLKCRSSKHRKKANLLKSVLFLDPDCLEQFI
jgi:hypothetical protein